MKKVKLIQYVRNYGIWFLRNHVNYLIKKHGAILVGDAMPKPKKRTWTGWIREEDIAVDLFDRKTLKFFGFDDKIGFTKVRITEV